MGCPSFDSLSAIHNINKNNANGQNIATILTLCTNVPVPLSRRCYFISGSRVVRNVTDRSNESLEFPQSASGVLLR